MTLYRLEPNGEVETVQSRRQDQTGIQDVWKYLMHFRELALRDGDRRFAAVAEQILDRVAASPESFATSRLLGRRVPGRGARLPRPHGPAPAARRAGHRRTEVLQGLAAGADPPRQHHRQHLRRNRLAQPPAGLRSGSRTTIREIASGLSTNPTFFKLRKGAAILDSVRMSPGSSAPATSAVTE